MAFSGYASISGQTVLSKSQVVNNILDQSDLYSIRGTNVFDVNISGNLLPVPDQTSFKNMSALSEYPVSSLFKIDGATTIYFSSQLGYCRYKSMAHLTSIWGDKYGSYLSILGSVPNALKFKGDCGPNEGVSIVGSNSILRTNFEGVSCRFGSMENLLMITGLADGNDLKQNSVAPAGTTDSGQVCNY